MAAIDDGVERVELAVGLLEGLGDALNALDDIHALNKVRVNLGGVAYEADDRRVMAFGHMGVEALAVNPGDKVFKLLWCGGVLDDGNHAILLWRCLGQPEF